MWSWTLLQHWQSALLLRNYAAHTYGGSVWFKPCTLTPVSNR
jgi:hypothetical protein